MTQPRGDAHAHAVVRLPLTPFKHYLTATGWRLADTNQRHTLWKPGDPPVADVPLPQPSIQIVLPLEETFTDYSEVIEDALKVLAYVEHRQAGEIAKDITDGGSDTVAVRLSPDAPPGEAPLDLAYTAVKALKNLIVGSASGLDVSSLVLPLRRPQRAEDFTRRVRLSTQPGSFVLSLGIPLSDPDAHASAASDAEDGALIPLSEVPGPAPFGRRLTDRLLAGVREAQVLADRVNAGDQALRAFGKQRSRAANATELAALADLGGPDRALYQLRVAQSPLVGGRSDAALLAVTPGQQRIFAEAADYLRTRQPRSGVSVCGLVVRLFRIGSSGSGQVSIHGTDDDSGVQRRFRVDLGEEDYTKAITAHRQGLQVIATGDIDVRGNHLSLSRLTAFQTIPSLDDEVRDSTTPPSTDPSRPRSAPPPVRTRSEASDGLSPRASGRGTWPSR